MAEQKSNQAKEPSFWDKVEREWNKVATKLDDVFTPEENKTKEGQKNEQNGQTTYVTYNSSQAQNQQPPPLPQKHTQSQQAPPLPPKNANGTANNHSQSQNPKEEKGFVKDLEKAGNTVAKWFDDLGNKLDKAIDGDKTTAKK
eukprot:TRINITY_DN2192_c0_g1_i1.p1 TRINITY_DN2192_c0_g1~~TRINITY_DN2192_c0_g1_i1.p1  ORF type:complete len:143 (-),score=38.43 TRINITY_DN2192_c0_g1_i1:41-469(-)